MPWRSAGPWARCCGTGSTTRPSSPSAPFRRQAGALLATGFLGGLTTFSAFSLDLAQLLSQGLVARAAVYLAATLLLAMLGFYLGAGVTKLVLP